MEDKYQDNKDFGKKYEDQRRGISVYQSPENKDHFMIEASQNSNLGKLALFAFSDRNIVGPNCDLSDLPYVFYYSQKFNDTISVNLYDMNISVGKGDKNYEEIKENLENLVQ